MTACCSTSRTATAPKVITTVRDTVNFAFWHSATFNNNATKVVFTDELGGGGAATCNPEIGPTAAPTPSTTSSARATSRKLEFRSYFKIPRTNTDTENCVAHNGSLIPVHGPGHHGAGVVPGRHLGLGLHQLAPAQGDRLLGARARLGRRRSICGGSWSAYWYNGYIYSNDIEKGLDVLELKDRRTDPAKYKRT